MTIYEKLLEVQGLIKSPKSQTNEFGKYKYRSCEDILEAIKPLLQKVKLTLILNDDLQMIGERYYIKATARLIDVENGVELLNTAFAREEEVKKGMDGSQITGASSSYARKYALNGLFNIDDTKDSDTTNKNELATKGQVERMAELNVKMSGIKAKYNIEKLEELTFQQADFVIRSKEKALQKEEQTKKEEVI
ncbi:MAG: ERF family protein [Clostridia bacterium]